MDEIVTRFYNPFGSSMRDRLRIIMAIAYQCRFLRFNTYKLVPRSARHGSHCEQFRGKKFTNITLILHVQIQNKQSYTLTLE